MRILIGMAAQMKLLAGIAPLALLLAGCGGGGGGSTEGSGGGETAAMKLFEPTQKQQEKTVLPIVDETIAELEGYEPISSQKAKLDIFIKALTEATEKPRNFLAEEGEKEPYREARARAADMGTYLCGQA